MHPKDRQKQLDAVISNLGLDTIGIEIPNVLSVSQRIENAVNAIATAIQNAAQLGQNGIDKATELKALLLDFGVRLSTQQQITAAQAQLLHLIVGGDTVAQSLQQLYELLQADITNENATFADVLAKITIVNNKADANTSALLLTAKTSELTVVRSIAESASQGLTTKADNSALATINTSIATVNSALTVTNSNVATISTNLAQARTLAQQGVDAAGNALTEANKRVLRSGDTMLGPLNVPAPVASSQPLLLGQNPNGENRPFREFRDVQSTPVVGKSPVTGETTIIDKMNLGRAVSPRTLQLTVTGTTLSTIAVTVSLYLVNSAGVVQATAFFQQQLAVGAFAVLNKLIEISGANGAKFPEVPAGNGIALGISAGKAQGNIDTILVSPTT